MAEVTLADWERSALRSPDKWVRFQLANWDFIRPTYAEFVDCVLTGITCVYRLLERNPQQLFDQNEDKITTELVNGLECLGFDASHDTMVGGHCDVTVKYLGTYLWLGEAKLDKDTGWVWDGFQQLTTRYGVGTAGADSGGMLIYCRKPDMAGFMARWQSRLTTELASAQIASSSRCAAAFESVTVLARTGLPYTVQHLPLSVHFDPEV